MVFSSAATAAMRPHQTKVTDYFSTKKHQWSPAGKRHRVCDEKAALFECLSESDSFTAIRSPVQKRRKMCTEEKIAMVACCSASDSLKTIEASAVITKVYVICLAGGRMA